MMKKIMMSVLVVALMITFSGCISHLSYTQSKKEVIAEKIMTTGDENAIRAFRSGDAVGIGIDVTAGETLLKHPWRQLGAAILDCAILYGAYEGIKTLEDNSSHSKSSSTSTDTSGNESTVIVIEDSQNTTVNVTNESQNEDNN